MQTTHVLIPLTSVPLPGHGTPASAAAAAADNVPRQLWLRQVLIGVLTLVVTWAGFYAYRTHAQIVQTIGKDAVPSIVAAEKIRTSLADAHTQIINVFLTDAAPGSSAVQAYGKAMDRARDYLVSASQNITYGDEERLPILAVLQQLAQYERLIGLAQANKGYGDALGRADAVMRERILPAAAALDQANFAHLDAAFTEGRQQARLALYAFLGLAGLLVLALLETQVKLRITFRRVLNPAIAAGLLLMLVGVLVFANRAQHLMLDIRSAKEDAFDSVHALSQAQALAYAANAHESMYLLMHGRTMQAAQAELFQGVAQKMFLPGLADSGRMPTDLQSLKGKGLLADELANITFDGEEALARATLKGWQEYIRVDAQIRNLEGAGRHDEAVALCLGTQPGQSDWAFANFMKDLAATLKLNEDHFEQSIDEALRSLRLLWLLLLPVFFGPILGTAVGLRQRLAEFRA